VLSNNKTRRNMIKRLKRIIASVTAGLTTAALVAVPVAAASVTVNGNNLAASGWSSSTTTGGTVSFETAADAPLGSGVAKLTTSADNDSRARLTTTIPSGTLFSDVNELGYASKVDTASCDCGSVSMFVRIDLDGNLTTTDDQTALVHEPYWQNDESPDPAPVVQDVWQTWDVDEGVFWSSNTTAGFTAGSGGPPFYDLDEAKALAPNAVVTEIGVYIGSFNPSYVTYADAVTFNGTTYDFEAGTIGLPATKDECKKGGWQNFTAPFTFKNQGDCVSFYETMNKKLKTNSSTHVLSSTDQDGLNLNLADGIWYKVTVSGTWTNRGVEEVDSECTSYEGGDWMNAVTGGYSPDLLDVQINQAFVNWGACSEENTYTRWVKGTSAAENLRIFDGNTATNQQDPSWFGDNEGSLSVTVKSYSL
jgi:hypothetical protein